MVEFAIISECELEAAWLKAFYLAVIIKLLDYYKCLAMILVTGTL
jgi:hypothetical protein